MASNAFGLDLYRQLADRPGNRALSPASLSIALAMTYGGARADTAKEMAQVLHLPDADPLHDGWAMVLARWTKDIKHVELAVANRLFGDKAYTFEEPFLALTRDRYAAPLEPRDFKNAPQEQRTYINGWIEQRTKDRIVDLIPRPTITPDTRLVLANALYMKAAWQEPFDHELTEDEAFYVDGDRPVQVPMMSRTGPARFGELDGIELLELDYQGGELGMLFVLPKKREGLPAVERKLSTESVESWVQTLKPQRVSVTMPRFKVAPPESWALKPVLRAMGIELAFERDKADFTGMANPPNPADRLFIDDVFHKAFVAVDEKGTEAAAATAVVAMWGAKEAPAEPARFLADHPYLFLIRDLQNQAILFVGRVVDPSKT